MKTINMPVVILSLFLTAFEASGQVLPSLDPAKELHHYIHEAWTMEDGLPSNSVWSITQTADGYIWLGTYHGLVRFNGSDFHLFNRSNTPQFQTNRFLHIQADPHKGLWVATQENHIVKYDGVFTRHIPPDSLNMGTIQCLDPAGPGALWIGTNHGLFYFSNEGYRDVSLGIHHPDIISLSAGHQGALWIATREQGILHWRNGSARHFTEASGLPESRIISLTSDANGTPWFLTQSRNLYSMKEGAVKFEGQINAGKPVLYMDRSGTLWAGDAGIWRFANRRVSRFTVSDGLTDNRVRSLFEDREGSLWIGTYGGGLNRFMDGNIRSLTTKDGLDYQTIWSVYQDPQGPLWFGTSIGTIQSYENGILGDKVKCTNKTHGNYILTVYRDRFGRLWSGTTDGLFKIVGIKSQLIKNTKDLSICSIIQPDSASDRLLLGTFRHGLLWMNSEGRLSPFSSILDNNWRIYFLRENPKQPKVIWCGSDHGLLRIEENSAQLFNIENGLTSNYITNLAFGEEGRLWISTMGGGLNWWDGERFNALTTDDGLYEDIAWSVTEDDSGRLWMSTDRGLFYVQKNDVLSSERPVTSTVFTKKDGLKAMEFVGSGNPVAIQAETNHLAYPTTQGVALIDPNRQNVNSLQPPVVIESIQVDKIAIDPEKHATIPPGQRNLEIHYAALTFKDAAKVHYRYQLHGYDKEWVEAGTRRVAYYNGLTPGEYTFRVIACNNSGVWNENGASCSFRLRPFFYEFWLFRLALGILGVFIFYQLFHQRLVRERARTQALQHEIDERKLVESALKQSQNQLQAIFDNTSSIMFMKDVQGRYLMINRQYQELIHISMEEILGKTDADVFPPKTASQLMKNDQQVLSEKKLMEFEEEVDYKGDCQIYISVKFPLYDAENNLKALCGISTDITQRKQNEEEMRHLRNLLSNIINSMPSALVGVDIEGRVTQWNNGAELVTHISSGQAKGKPVHEVFPQCHLELEKIKRAIQKRQIEQSLKVRHQREGDTMFCDITIFPLIANGVEGAVIRVDDVTERVRMEERLIQSEKMMSVGGLAAGMAHEINNPLSGILQTLQVLENRLRMNLPKNREIADTCGLPTDKMYAYLQKRDLFKMIDMMKESAKRAADIVSNMLSFARKSESKFQSVNINDLLDNTLALCYTDYDLKKNYDFRAIDIIKEYDPHLPEVNCETGKIQQVFLNLLMNGAQAMAGVGTKAKETSSETNHFYIRTAQEEAYIRIEIEDNGPGMTEETRRRLFEPFFTTKDVGVGTGLGLSVSYFIITENHGGTMHVDSAPGEGANFTIRLPLK